jgi:TolB-like protein/tetratricopeptide (TPR) repeat protein
MGVGELSGRIAAALSDRYTIEGELGRGGMATVFLAHDARHDRRVAIKVLDPALGDLLGAERFLREIQLAARLSHPHILPLYDSGQVDGLLYYVMPCVRGETLRALLARERQLPIAQAVQWTARIALALDHAHREGVVHRDIKPENILLQDGEPLLADFGIALAVGEGAGNRLTGTGLAVGTPWYMSPEQVTGDRRLDARSDIYSLGCVLFELLTGEPPHTGPTAQAVLARVLTEAPRPLRVLRPSASPALERVLAKALATVPADRYATAAQFAEALVQALAADAGAETAAFAVPAAAPGPPPAGESGAARPLLAWVPIAVGLLAIALLVVGGVALQRRAAPSGPPGGAIAPGPAQSAAVGKSIAVLPFENLSSDRDNAYFASGMQDEILTRVAGIADLKVISRSSTVGYASRPDDLKRVGHELGVATVLEGSVQKAGGKARINVRLVDANTGAQLWAESYDGDLGDVFGVERDVAEKVAAALKARLLPGETQLVASVPTRVPAAFDAFLRAEVLATRGHDQLEFVASSMPEAIVLYERAIRLDPTFALAWAELARAHLYLYHHAPDVTAARAAAAKAAVGRALQLQPGLGQAHLALALYQLWVEHDYSQSYRELALAQQTLPNNADIVHFLASVARRQGRWDEAIRGFQREAVLAPGNPNAYAQLAVTYEALRRYPEADAAFARAQAVAPDPGEQWRDRADNRILWTGDTALLREGVARLVPGSAPFARQATARYALAWLTRDFAGLARMARADAPAAPGGISPRVELQRRVALARALVLSGDAAGARAAGAELRAYLQQAIRRQPDDPEMHRWLGVALAGLGEKAAAVREARRATELLPVGLDSLDGPVYLGSLAEVLTTVGEKGEAVDLLRRLLALPGGGVVSVARLRVDPVWDSLRADPGFQRLISP